jgi:hypothetical protein
VDQEMDEGCNRALRGGEKGGERDERGNES